MHERAFHALTRTFMHVSGIPHHVLIIKTKYFITWFLKPKYAERRPETCINVHFSLCINVHVSGLPSPYFDFKKKTIT